MKGLKIYWNLSLSLSLVLCVLLGVKIRFCSNLSKSWEVMISGRLPIDRNWMFLSRCWLFLLPMFSNIFRALRLCMRCSPPRQGSSARWMTIYWLRGWSDWLVTTLKPYISITSKIRWDRAEHFCWRVLNPLRGSWKTKIMWELFRWWTRSCSVLLIWLMLVIVFSSSWWSTLTVKYFARIRLCIWRLSICSNRPSLKQPWMAWGLTQNIRLFSAWTIWISWSGGSETKNTTSTWWVRWRKWRWGETTKSCRITSSASITQSPINTWFWILV